jgi:Family of unknown function (DUF5694)
MLNKALLTATLVCNLSIAADYQPLFNPSKLKRSGDDASNQVLVLATPHLSGLPETFTPDHLGLLIKKLSAWKPQVIMIETLSGSQCDYMARHVGRYSDTIATYCWDTTTARRASGLDIPAAIVEVDKRFSNWPTDPTPAQRRHLALLFLAAGDPVSALVQWLRLPADERKSGDGLDAALVESLNTLIDKRNEKSLIAAQLAARLGLERVYPMDDHTADFNVSDEQGYNDALKRIWNNPYVTQRSKQDALLHAHLDSDEGVLNLYRAYNQPDYPQLVYQGDFGAALQDKSAHEFGRLYVGYWETRNIRMVGNIREVLAITPGQRALVIVGASHKGYFDAYLSMMHDVRLVDTRNVLR